jgi:hypothetical protein
MEELAIGRVVSDQADRLGGRASLPPICGRLGNNHASFIKGTSPRPGGRQTGQR